MKDIAYAHHYKRKGNIYGFDRLEQLTTNNIY